MPLSKVSVGQVRPRDAALAAEQAREAADLGSLVLLAALDDQIVGDVARR